MKFPKFNVRQRVREWVDRKIADAVQQHMPSKDTLIRVAVSQIDKQAVAELVDTPTFRKNVAAFVSEAIDLDELAEKAAESVDVSDVAHYMDASDVAAHVDVDTSDIADRVMEDLDVSELAGHLDYDKLAEVLVSKLKEAWA